MDKKADYQKQVDAWLADSASRWTRLKRVAKGIYYNTAPKRLRVFGVAHWLSKTALASSAPVFAWAYGSIHGAVAIAAGVVIFGWNVVINALDNMSREKAEPQLDNQTDIMVRFGDLLKATTRSNIEVAERDDAIRACLGILEIFTRQTIKAKKGTVSVSLVLYQGTSNSRMKIKHRNPGNERPVNREFDSDKILGHHVCQNNGEPRVVNDLREFGKVSIASPTQSRVDYRSMFFIPLETKNGNSPRPRGFISIDCSQPYAFYGNRANEIIVTCEPIVNHIGELLQERSDVNRSEKPIRSRTSGPTKDIAASSRAEE